LRTLVEAVAEAWAEVVGASAVAGAITVAAVGGAGGMSPPRRWRCSTPAPSRAVPSPSRGAAAARVAAVVLAAVSVEVASAGRLDADVSNHSELSRTTTKSMKAPTARAVCPERFMSAKQVEKKD
tara:strand:+ start:215 stop:589 length:375 start_codon:yes stop_codon:yes gene_type:complete